MFVNVEQKNEIFYITLNRPDVRNAFHPEMIEQLTKAFEDANASEARLVYLTGEGKSFCAGADLEWMKSMKDFSFVENKQDSENLFAMFEAARNCALPVLGRVHGHVMGGAIGLVAICDFVAAEQDTQFCFSEVKLGLVPAVISPFVLRKMQMAPAREYMLTGRVFSAEEAHLSGLLSFSGKSKDVDSYIEGVVKNIFSAGPMGVRETKSLINKVNQPMFHGLRDETSKVIAERRVSEEGQLGLSSFFKKEAAPWKKDFDGKL